MAHHKPTTENKDGDNKKTCGQKFTGFFQDNFNKLKSKLDCHKKPKADDNKPAPEPAPAPSVGPRR